MSQIPNFTSTGDLPPGVYTATMEDVRTRFGSATPARLIMFQRLERACDLAKRTHFLKRLIVFGSFVTAKPEPNDVDIFMIMDDDFILDSLPEEERLLFDHAQADSLFGMSVFWLRESAIMGTEEESIAFWQGTRGGGKRGIIEIVEVNA
jgi:hypothetical protein